jgi:hypothetical protein
VESQHEIGFTDAQYSADPEWDKVFESSESMRLHQLVPSEVGFFEASARVHDIRELHFPILQPIATRSQRKDLSGRFLDSYLKPWGTSPGAVVIQVRFQDFLNNLPGFDHVLGEVVFPFSKLTMAGEVSGWFQVLDVGTTVNTRVDRLVGQSGEGAELDDTAARDQAPCIFVSLQWDPPTKDSEADETDREISNAIQEELVRSSLITRQNKFDFLGSSLGAVNTALGRSRWWTL